MGTIVPPDLSDCGYRSTRIGGSWVATDGMAGWSEFGASVQLTVKDNRANANSNEQTACNSQEKQTVWPHITEIERVTQKYPNTNCEEAVPHEVKELEGFFD